VQVGGNTYILVADAAGRLRYESPSMFVQAGPQAIGNIDGAKVTYYSGPVVVTTGNNKNEKAHCHRFVLLVLFDVGN